MSLWNELKRRNIFRVAAAYVVIGWLLLQVADIVLGLTGAPDWFGKALIALLLLGFVPVMALSWVFEVGPDGIRVDDGTAERNTSPQARRLDIVTLAAVVLVMLLMVGQHLAPALLNPPPQEPVAARTVSREAPASEPAERPVAPLDDFSAPPGSIAVLPFTNRSPDPDTGYFVDGVHDDLLTELSRNPELTVISRTSVMEYRDTTKNLRQIGDELGVAHVLEGAVQRAGQRVRINAQLIDAETDAHLWADTFDRELTPENVFDIQTEIATAIARALGRTLGTSADEASPTVAATDNPKAFDAYLRARARSELPSEEIIRERIRLYREALSHDPEFALAMGELGREYTNLYWYVTRRDEDRRRGGEWIDRALALEPDNPILQMARAEHLYRADLDYEGALAALDIAEKGLPGDARIFRLRAYVQRRAGRPEPTLEALTTAALLDPRSIEVLNTLVETHWLLGDLKSARRWNARMISIPDTPRSLVLTMPYAELAVRGDVETAMAAMDRLPPDALVGASFFNHKDRFIFPFVANDYERAARALDSLDRDFDAVEDQFHLTPIPLMRAQLAAALGESAAQREHATQALREFDDELEQHPDDYRAWSQRAIALALLGREDDARASTERALAHPVPVRDAVIRIELARHGLLALAQVADTPTVIEAAERYLSATMKYWTIHGLVLFPAFDRHAEDPAFRALVARHAREDAAQ